MNEEKDVPITLGENICYRQEKQYISISGVKKIRRLAEDNLIFSIYSGNRYLIIRLKFENISAEFLI